MRDFSEIMACVGGSPRCAVPAVLCDGLLEGVEASGQAQKVVLACLWLAGPYLRRSQPVRVYCPLADLAVLTGIAQQRRLAPVRAALGAARDVRIGGADGIRLFRMLEEVSHCGVSGAHWILTPEIAEMIAAPDVFGIIDMREVVALRSAVDLLVYRRVVRVRNMRHAKAWIALDDTVPCLGAGMRPGQATARIARAAQRVAGCIGDRIDVVSCRVPGGRRLSGWSLGVTRKDRRSGADAGRDMA